MSACEGEPAEAARGCGAHESGAAPAARRRRLLAALVLLGPIGGVARFGHGYPLAGWVNANGAGALYVMGWIWLYCLCDPRAGVGRVSAAVLLITCALEALQLWHPPWLEALRGTPAGRLLLGTTFSWSDVPPYFGGAVLGGAFVKWVADRPGSPRDAIAGG